MHQLQSVIDQIRIALMKERYESSPELQDLSKELHDLTRQFNERLRRCGEYLRQGLRAEAIHEAESEPRLLDCVAVLESFSDEERKAWADLCEYLELPVAEPVLRDVAIMIDEAYTEHAPLDKLMRQHRRLALQRAPLSVRLKVVRKLAQLDPNSEHWADDVGRYEEARLAQITVEAKSLKKAPSSSALNELLDEVTSKDWINPPSPKIVSSIRAIQHEGIRSQAQATLEDLEQVLHQAYSALNFPQARQAYAQWQQVLPTAELPQDDPLITRNLAALTWCQQELKREADDAAWNAHLRSVETMLRNADATLDAMQRLVRQTERFERPLPAAVATKLTNRLQSISSQNRRRRQTIIASVAAGTLTLTIAIVMAIVASNEASYRSQITQRLLEMSDRGDVKQAAELVKQFDPRWQQVPAWIDAKSRLASAQDALANREHRLELLFRHAESIHEADEKNFERTIEEAKLVAYAKPVLDALKQQFEQRSRSLITDRQQIRNKREEKFAARIDAQEEKLKRLKSQLLTMESAEFTSLRDDIRDALETMSKEQALPANQSADIKSKLNQLQDLDQQRTRSLRARKLFADLQKQSRIPFVTRSGATIEIYSTTLSAGAEALKPSAVAVELLQSAQEVAAWKSLYTVQLVLPTESAGMFPTDLQKIQSRQAELKRLLEENPLCPLRDVIHQYSHVLGVLEERNKAVTHFRDDFLALVKMSGLYVVQDDSKPRPYYITDATELVTNSPSILIRAWKIDNETREARLSRSKLKTPKPAPAPQKRLTDSFKPCLGSLTCDNWEDVCRELVESTLQAPEVDPILKLDILSNVNEMSTSGNPTLKSQRGFQDYVSMLRIAQSKIGPDIDWADPANDKVENLRKTAQVSVDSLSRLDLSKVWAAPPSPFADVARKLRTRYEAIGYMSRDDDQRPRLDITLQPREPCEILASVRTDNATAPKVTHRFEVIGQLTPEGRVTTTDAFTKHFCTGRLVFARTATE